MVRYSIRTLMAAVAVAALCCAVVPFILAFFQTNCTFTPLAQCETNVHNVALALLAYCNVNGTFPSGTVPNANLAANNRLGLYVPATPYLDYAELSAASIGPCRGTVVSIARSPVSVLAY
jgi:hypothetical protein